MKGALDRLISVGLQERNGGREKKEEKNSNKRDIKKSKRKSVKLKTEECWTSTNTRRNFLWVLSSEIAIFQSLVQLDLCVYLLVNMKCQC